MTLCSQHNPMFAARNDAEVVQMARDAQKERNDLLAALDAAGWDRESEQKIDAIDAKLHRLDEELCARDLPWPRE